jgi:uncharacterized small protein (DUF1192 family)
VQNLNIRETKAQMGDIDELKEVVAQLQKEVTRLSGEQLA